MILSSSQHHYKSLFTISLLITLLTGCGGGGTEETAASNSIQADTSSQIASSAVNKSPQPSSSPTAVVSKTSSSASTVASITSKSSSSKSVASVPGNASSLSSSSQPNNSAHIESIELKWTHPTQRANGGYLELHEIAGYELRRKNTRTPSPLYIDIQGNTTTSYTLSDIKPDDVIDIAVFDSFGLYSDFIQIYPQ